MAASRTLLGPLEDIYGVTQDSLRSSRGYLWRQAGLLGPLEDTCGVKQDSLRSARGYLWR
jgi:hypothetical protein